MVSFSCEGCNETMLKKKVAPHINWCRSAVSCIDCSQTFPGQTFKQHNQCITEDQKYQGKLYKSKDMKKSSTEKNSELNDISPRQAEVSKQEQPKTQEGSKTKRKIRKIKKHEALKTVKSTGTMPKPIKVAKQQSLKKVLKTLRKEHKMKKSKLLEHLSVSENGELVLI